MEEPLVSFETAKLAKEKRFNIDVEYSFYYDGKDIEEVHISDYDFNFNNEKTNYISRPTQSLLQKWLREKHSLHITVHIHKEGYSVNVEDLKGKYGIDLIYSTIISSISSNEYIESFEKALEIGLEESLKLVKVKSKTK